MTNRRDLIRGGAALGVAAWITPSVITLDSVAAAGPSTPCEIPTVGPFTKYIPAPATIQEGTPGLDNNVDTWVWLEQGPVQLSSALTVNRTSIGTFNGTSDQAATIASGTWVCSYYVHGDRLDDNGTLTGSLQFDSCNILGLIYRTTELTNSAFLQAPATTYFNAPMESSDSMTFANLPIIGSTLSWSMQFGGALDGIRVITSCP